MYRAENIMKKYLLLLLLVVTPLQAEIYDISKFDLNRYKGKVVYLDFWASWCKPCRESFPWMNKLLDRYPADKFTVITINLDAEASEMQRFLARFPASFDIYQDASGSIAEKFKLEAMPTSYLIDSDGKVVGKHVGFYNSKISEYEREIEELL
jgi:thiol-disulfide isomerase/thioredoxin